MGAPGAAGLGGGTAGFHAAHGGVAADAGAVFEEPEVELPGGDVDVDDLDAGAVAEGNASTGALATEDASAFFKLPEVVGEVGDADHSFDEEAGGLDEDAEAGNAGDDAVDDIADVLGEELKDFDGAEFAFGVGGAAFGVGEVLAEGDEGSVVGGHAERFGHEARAAAHAGLAAGDFDCFGLWSGLGDFSGAGFSFFGFGFLLFGAGFHFEDGVEAAVDDEVGVAADGTGEVGIVFAGKGVVADGLWGIFGAAHGLENGEVDGVGDGCSADAVEDSLECFAVHDLGDFFARDEHELADGFGAGDVGVGMDAAQDGEVGFGEPAADGFIGFDHEHFNDFVGEGVVFGAGVDDVAFVVDDEFDFGEIEDDHSLGEAALADGAGKAVHVDEEFSDVIADGDDFGIGRCVEESLGVDLADAFGVVDECLCLFVGEAFFAADEGVGEARADDAASGVVANEGGFGEAGLVFLEGADAVGEDFGEHRNDVAGEVGGVAAGACFDIHGGFDDDEGGDVGNVDSEFPDGFAGAVLHEAFDIGFGLLGLEARGAFELAEGDGVVEVAGVIGVDGGDEFVGEVFAVGHELSRVVGHGGGAGLGEDGFGEGAGEVELADDALEFYLGLAFSAEDFGDDALGELVALGIFEDFEDDFVIFGTVFGGDVADFDGGFEDVAVGDDDPSTGLFGKRADDFIGGAFENFDDAAGDIFSVAGVVFFADDDFSGDVVAGDGVEVFACGDEEIAVGVGFVRDDETEAAGGLAENAGDFVSDGGESEGAAGGDNDFVGGGEFIDGPFEFFLALRRDAELFGEVGGADRFAVLAAEEVDDRVVVLLGQNRTPLGVAWRRGRTAESRSTKRAARDATQV